MKNSFVIILSLFISTSYAQVNFGAKGGVSFDRFVNEENDIIENENSITQTFSFFAEYSFRENLAIMSGLRFRKYNYIEVDYSPQFGSDLDPVTFTVDPFKSWIETNIVSNYISLPINLVYKMQKPKWASRFYAGLNPMVAINEQGSALIVACGDTESATPTLNDLVALRELLVNGQIGAMLDFNISDRSSIVLDFGSEINIPTLLRNNAGDIKLNNRIISYEINIGYRYHLVANMPK